MVKVNFYDYAPAKEHYTEQELIEIWKRIDADMAKKNILKRIKRFFGLAF